MEGFDLDLACARYFEQKARNDKALSDLKAAQKEERETLKDEIECGHRNAFAYALGDANSQEAADLLKEEVERRLKE